MTNFFSRFALSTTLCFLVTTSVIARADEQQGSGQISEIDTGWQISNSYSTANLTQSFDTHKWHEWRYAIDDRLRLKEGWKFLVSYPVIGMSQGEVIGLLGSPEQKKTDSGNIDYYSLTTSSCVQKPIFYLELKYCDNRVCAFRTEHFTLPSVEARGKEVWTRIHAIELAAQKELTAQSQR